MAAKGLDPVIVIAGDDELAKREALDTLRERFRELNGGEGDEIVLDGSRDAGELGAAVFEELSTRPFDGGRKLVVVRGAEEFAKKKKDALIDYLDRPAGFSHLVLVVRSLGGGRNVFRDRLKKLHAYHAFARPEDTVAPWKKGRRPDDTDLKRWIEQRARDRKVKLDRDVAPILAQRLGKNLEEIDALFERWRLMKVNPVTREHLKAIETRHRRADTFALSGAVFRRDVREAMELLSCILDEGIEVMGKRVKKANEILPLLTGLFFKKYRELLRAEAHLAAGNGRQSLVDAVGIKSFLLAETCETLKRFPPGGLRYGLGRLIEADRAVKFRGEAPEAVLVDLIVDLIRGGPATARRARASLTRAEATR